MQHLALLLTTIIAGVFCSNPELSWETLTDRCELPPGYASLNVNRVSLPFIVTTMGTFSATDTAADLYSQLIITNTNQAKVKSFALWATQVNTGERVGTWDCCSEVAPVFRQRTSCPSTLVSGGSIAPAGNYIYDMEFFYYPPSDAVGHQVQLSGVLVVEGKDGEDVAYQFFSYLNVKANPSKKRITSFEKRALTQVTPPLRVGTCSSRNGYPASKFLLPPFKKYFHVPTQAKFSLFKCDLEGRCIYYTEITAKNISVQLFPAPAKKTELYVYGQESTGYFGIPGPLIKGCVGQQIMVRFINTMTFPDGSPRNISIHLHGAASFAPYDGWADAVIGDGHYKDYFYPNNRPATLWYHDHAFTITAPNAYHGLFGQYWVSNCCEDYSDVIPNEKYDLPFAVHDAVFDENYQLLFDKFGAHKNDIFGDHIMVNGVPWPYINVEPRKYRFRMLVSSISRKYNFRFSNNMVFWIFAADGGMLQQPRPVTTYFHGQAERYEIIVDFSQVPFGESVYLMNDGYPGTPNFCQTHLVTKFNVVKPFDASIKEPRWTHEEFQTWGLLPEGVKPMKDIIPESVRAAARALEKPDRTATFVRSNGEWKINVDPPIDQVSKLGLAGKPLSWGQTFVLPQPHVAMDPNANSFEVWEFVNGGGGWVHPIHPHLIDAFVIARGGSLEEIPPWEIEAAKDVFFLHPSAKVRILGRMGPHAGSYMVHCHNLVHEDNDMLLAFGTQPNNGVQKGQLKDDLGNLHLIRSPVVNHNNFQESLRNPMFAPTVQFPVGTGLTPSQAIMANIRTAPYYTFYPNVDDPIRKNGAVTPPLGKNPLNPFEVDYKCWRAREPRPLFVPTIVTPITEPIPSPKI